MNFPLKLSALKRLFPASQKLTVGTARTRSAGSYQKILCCLVALTWPFAAAFAQSSSTQQSSSSSQQSSTQNQTQSQTQPATLDPPPQKQDSLAEAARKAKANKPATKAKVLTEEDLSMLKGPGVSVVGDAPTPTKGAQRAQPGGNGGDSKEQYWRGRARQYLDQIAQMDELIAQKKEEIRKFGSGGFDVTTGRKDNIAYINDRNAQLKQMEDRKAELEKRLEELQDEGRKAGVPSSWLR
jgi:hypothetical protein